MRKSAIALALFASLSSLTAAQADDDFSALLADLSFGDVPVLNEPLTPITELEQPLQPLTMPEITAPQATLQPPVSTQAQPAPETIDLNAAFALQETSEVQATTVGHLFHHQDDNACDSAQVCTPHTAPNLPNSTFYQYFRSNKCNTNVWDGYRQPCRSANKCINGTCDCFDEDKSCFGGDCGEIIDAPVVECSPCNVRPRRQILPIKKSCDDHVKCDTGCDG